VPPGAALSNMRLTPRADCPYLPAMWSLSTSPETDYAMPFGPSSRPHDACTSPRYRLPSWWEFEHDQLASGPGFCCRRR